MQEDFPRERKWELGGLFSCSGINNLSFLGEWSEEPRYPHQGIISSLSCWFDWWGCWVIISSIFPKFNSHRLGSVKREVNFILSATDTENLSVFINLSYLHFQRVIWRRRWEVKKDFRGIFCGSFAEFVAAGRLQEIWQNKFCLAEKARGGGSSNIWREWETCGRRDEHQSFIWDIVPSEREKQEQMSAGTNQPFAF